MSRLVMVVMLFILVVNLTLVWLEKSGPRGEMIQSLGLMQKIIFILGMAMTKGSGVAEVTK